MSPSQYYTIYHMLEGRGFVCFVFDPASVHGPKPKHTKPLPPTSKQMINGGRKVNSGF